MSEKLGWPEGPGPLKTTPGCGADRHIGIDSGSQCRQGGESVGAGGVQDGRWGLAKACGFLGLFYSHLKVGTRTLIREGRSYPEYTVPTPFHS